MNSKILIIIVAIVIAGAGFFGGIQYQKSQVGNFAGGQGGFRQRGVAGAGQGQAAFRPVRGSILSIDTNGITVKLQDGSSKIIILPGSTVFMKEASASKDDVKTGDMVMVTGTNNSDGSITAQNVQINPPAFRALTTPQPTQ